MAFFQSYNPNYKMKPFKPDFKSLAKDLEHNDREIVNGESAGHSVAYND